MEVHWKAHFAAVQSNQPNPATTFHPSLRHLWFFQFYYDVENDWNKCFQIFKDKVLHKTYFIEILDKVCFPSRIVFILCPEFLYLLSCKNKALTASINIEFPWKTPVEFTSIFLVPLDPPPRIWHISFKAVCSNRLFSSFGTLSEGVMSPTMAVH